MSRYIKRKEEGFRVKLNRRSLLKWGITCSGAVLLERGGVKLLAAKEIKQGLSVSPRTGRERKAIPSTCLHHGGGCGIIGFVEEGKLVKIQGNPKHPQNRGRLCGRGQAGINLFYDPERVLSPLKRIGTRGGGKWKEISWEEAYNEIVFRLRELQDKGKPEELFFYSEAVDRVPGFTKRFLQAFGTPHHIGDGFGDKSNKQIALGLTWGVGEAISDIAHSRYILNFGANPFEGHMVTALAQRIVETRLAGAKLITFDVRLSQTAGKSDEWYPIRPGTDGLVILAMASVIMGEGLYDREFLSKWTNYPVDKLSEYLKQFSPEWAEKESGIKAEYIRKIAREFATIRPSTTLSGGGIYEHQNGVYTERGIGLLNAIVGNIDIKGGHCLPRDYTFNNLDLKPQIVSPDNSISSGLINHQQTISLIKKGSLKLGIYMSHGANPAYSSPDNNFVVEVLKDEKLIPYSVAIDSYMTETAALADIILPDTTYLESWGLVSGTSLDLIPYVSIIQPVIKPLKKVVPFEEMLIELAQRLMGDVSAHFNLGPIEEYLKRAISPIDGLIRVGGVDLLKEQGFWYDPEAKSLDKSYEIGGFKTPSGKFEIYSGRLEEKGFNPLPVYEPNHKNMAKDELILVTYGLNVLSQRSANCKWLSEITHDNPLLIHPEAARERGIKGGDLVKVTSPMGSLITKVRITEGINPGVVAMARGLGHWEYGRIAQAKRFKSIDPDTHLIWWEEIGNGKNPNAIIVGITDPIGGGQAWMDTKVVVAKV